MSCRFRRLGLATAALSLMLPATVRADATPAVRTPVHAASGLVSPDLQSIQDAGRARVRALAERMRETPAGPQRTRLARDIIAAKREVGLAMDRARAALESGGAPFGAGATAEIEATMGDNLDNTTTPAGWSAPIVARNAPYTGGDHRPTAELTGNAPNTAIYFSVIQNSSGALPAWSYSLALDGEPIFAGQVLNPAAPGTWALQLLDTAVRGGRHTLESRSDAIDQILETNELDNAYGKQYVWSPLTTAFATPIVRPAPPLPGTGPIGNGDGFAYPRAVAAWVVSTAPLAEDDDYDLWVSEDYAGSTTGFSSLIDASLEGDNRTDFVVGGRYTGALSVFSQVQRWDAGTTAGFILDQSDARDHYFPTGILEATNQALDAMRLADVYEIHLSAGEVRGVILRRLAGDADLLVSAYSGESDVGVSRAFSLADPDYASPDLDYLVLEAPADGDYPIVVYRDTGTNANQPVRYTLTVSPNGLADVPARPPVAAPITFTGARPNPVHGAGRFDFILPAPARVRLTLFDALGRTLRTLADREFDAGTQSIAWDARDRGGRPLADGLYWARLEASGQTLARRVVIMH